MSNSGEAISKYTALEVPHVGGPKGRDGRDSASAGRQDQGVGSSALPCRWVRAAGKQARGPSVVLGSQMWKGAQAGAWAVSGCNTLYRNNNNQQLGMKPSLKPLKCIILRARVSCYSHLTEKNTEVPRAEVTKDAVGRKGAQVLSPSRLARASVLLTTGSCRKRRP